MKTRLAAINLADRAMNALTDDELAALIDALPEAAVEPFAAVLGEAGAIDKIAGTRLVASRGRVNGTLEQLTYALAESCLDQCIAKLGDSSENPSEDELRAASTELIETHSLGAVRLMLASAVLGEAKASAACIRLLKHDELLKLPPAPEHAKVVAVVAVEDDPAREALRDRRKDERRRKAAEAQIRREQAQNARRKT